MSNNNDELDRETDVEEAAVETELEGEEEEEEEEFDPLAKFEGQKGFTIRTTSGDDKFIPGTEPIRVLDLLSKSGLSFVQPMEIYYLNTLIATNYMLPVDSIIMVGTAVKGA